MKKRKKGDTLVELIAAIAILALASAGSSMAISVSSKMWQANSRNLELNTFNQSICEDLKLRDKESLNKLYSKNRSFCFYSDNLDVNKPLAGEKNPDNLSKIMTEDYKDGKYKDYKVCNSEDTDYDTCKRNNTDKKSFGSMIVIDDKKQVNDYYPIYKVTVTTWNFAVKKSSTSSFYIGG